MSRSLPGMPWSGFAFGGLVAAAILAAAPPARAQCSDPPLQATIKFDASMPPDVTFSPLPAATPIKLRIQIENCSGQPVLTSAGFSTSDFFRRLYFTDPKGGTVINASEAPLHGYSPPLFCLSRSGVLLPQALPVSPIEALPGPQGEPATPHFFREYVIDDTRTLYATILPGHYRVKAVIPVDTFESDGTAIVANCDQFEGTTLANVTALTGRRAYTIESNTLEFVILGSPAADTSSITGTGPVAANGVAASTVTIALRDAADDPVQNVTPVFSATGSNNTIGACSATDASGESTCTLKSTTVEVKTLSITSPITKTGGTVSFVAPVASTGNSTIAGTSPVVADGVAASTVTITLKDASNDPVPGLTPTFSATGSGNTLGPCSATNASGVSTCTLKSTTAEVKTLALVTPIAKTGGTVSFTAGAASTGNSTITGTGPVAADGVAASTVTITLKDASSIPVAGATPAFSATGSNNTLGPCSATNASGVSTCTLKSTTAEVKTLALVAPVSKTGGTVTFVPTTPSANTSAISLGGSAGQVGVVPPPGQPGGSQVALSGKFTFTGALDLRGSAVTIDYLLGELKPGGAGELVKGNGGASRLPVVLPASSKSTAISGVFTNPSTERPSFQVEIRLKDAVKRQFDFTVKIDRASIPAAPKLCAGATPRTDLVTSLTIKPASGGPAIMTTSQAWRCRGSSLSLP